GAWPHVRTDFIAHQRTVGEAQGGVGLEVEGEMVVKVWGIITTYTQNAAAFGLTRFGTPGCAERPDRHADASHQAGLQQITTAHPLDLGGICLWQWHRESSLDAL